MPLNNETKPNLCKSTDVTTRHIRLIGHTFTMTSLFGVTCVQHGPVISVVEFWLCILWLLVQSPLVEITVCTADET